MQPILASERAAKTMHLVPRRATRAASREVWHCATVPHAFAHLVGSLTHRVRRGVSRCVPMICAQLLTRVLFTVSHPFPPSPVRVRLPPLGAPNSACGQLLYCTHGI